MKGMVFGGQLRKTNATPFASTILLLLLLSGPSSWAGDIVYPWRATTALVKAGDSFDVWFDADNGQSVNSVELRGPYHKITAAIKVVTGSWVYDETSGNKYDTRITATVPAGAPADRYDLVLLTSTKEEKSPAAVKVVKKFKTNYYVLHISDAHRFQGGYDDIVTLKKVSTIVEIANIIDPEVVFETGDNLYRPSDSRIDQMFNGIESQGIQGLRDFHAATFLAVGNHDYDINNDGSTGNYEYKADWYNKWYGLHAYNTAYGEGRFIVFNNGWGGYSNKHQIEDAVSWLNDVGPGNFRIGAGHGKSNPMLPLDNAADLDLILVGHNHYIADDNPEPINGKPIQYVASSIRDHAPEFNLFRVDAAKGSYTPVNGATAQDFAIENPADKNNPSSYKPKLALTYTKNNNGSAADNTAGIVNKFNFSINKARIRFVMPKGASYEVSSGTIEQQFDGTSYRIVDVSVNVNANSSKSVAISSDNTFPTSEPDADGDGTGDVCDSDNDNGNTDLKFPIRGIFYYPWFPQTWSVDGVDVWYDVELGHYSSDDQAVVDRHIQDLDYANIDVAIASWWGVDRQKEASRIPLLLDRTLAAKSDLKWAIYYESEGFGNPSLAELESDLAYLKARYAQHQAFARIDGKPVVFVYNADDPSCDVADRWVQATNGEWYVVLKVFGGYRDCASQPDAWHQYGPASPMSHFAGHSYNISPGFWRADEAAPRLARDPSRWSQNVRDMVASNERWQLITSFNEWGEGTATERCHDWASVSGYGVYLDALHSNGQDSGGAGNRKPEAEAGSGQSVFEGDAVTLNGGRSSDPDGRIVSYLWEQIDGTSVKLANSGSSKATFAAPAVGKSGDSLTFRITVTDDGGLTDSATCVVEVSGKPVSDSDGDGVPDDQDEFPYNADESVDTDGDGEGNNADTDDDNDGMPDAWELTYGLNPLKDDAAADLDEDDVSNINEFEAGTAPDHAEGNLKPDTPELLLPENGATVGLAPQFETDAFSDPNDNDDHRFTQWMVTRAFDGVCVFDVTTNSSLTSLTLPKQILEEETEYLWKARYLDNHKMPSEWSEEREFISGPADHDTDKNGVPDVQEVADTLDLDADGSSDIAQTDIKCVSMPFGEEEDQICISIKDAQNVEAIVSLEVQDPADPDLSSATNGKPNYFEFGLLDFKVLVANPGDETTLTIYLSRPAYDKGNIFKYDPVNQIWSDYSGYAEFSAGRREVILTLRDGGFGDADGIENGIIVDPLAFGSETDPSGGGSSDSPVEELVDGIVPDDLSCFISVAGNHSDNPDLRSFLSAVRGRGLVLLFVLILLGLGRKTSTVRARRNRND